MTIGERIKRLRMEKNMTQEELGAILGVKKATIQKYESGEIRNLAEFRGFTETCRLLRGPGGN